VPSHSHAVMQTNSNQTQCGTCQGANDTFGSIFSYSVSLPGGERVDLASQPIGPGGMHLHAPELSDMAYRSISMEEDFRFRPVQSLMSIEQLTTETDRPQKEVFEADGKVFAAPAADAGTTQIKRSTLKVFTTFNSQPTTVLYDTAAELPICPKLHQDVFLMRNKEDSPHTVTGIEGGRLLSCGMASAEIQMGDEVRTIVFIWWTPQASRSRSFPSTSSTASVFQSPATRQAVPLFSAGRTTFAATTEFIFPLLFLLTQRPTTWKEDHPT
jgi:hypothetical protein